MRLSVGMFLVAFVIAVILSQCDGNVHGEEVQTVLWTAHDVRVDGTDWCVAYLENGEMCDIDCRLVGVIDGGQYACK